MVASILSIFTTLTVLFLVLLSSTEARRPARPFLPVTRASGIDLSQYTVPVSNGTTSLPSPTTGLTLKAITLGRGTQNYTCASNSTAAPVALGAKADLFDASVLLPALPPSEGMLILNMLPGYLVSFDFSSITASSIPIIGHHFFNAKGVPTFNLGSLGQLNGKKTGDIAAPADACKGARGKGVGAVDWLALSDAGASTGLTLGYRVETAGGKAPATCAGQPKLVVVQYAALYWFYG